MAETSIVIRTDTSSAVRGVNNLAGAFGGLSSSIGGTSASSAGSIGLMGAALQNVGKGLNAMKSGVNLAGNSVVKMLKTTAKALAVVAAATGVLVLAYKGLHKVAKLSTKQNKESLELFQSINTRVKQLIGSFSAFVLESLNVEGALELVNSFLFNLQEGLNSAGIDSLNLKFDLADLVEMGLNVLAGAFRVAADVIPPVVNAFEPLAEGLSGIGDLAGSLISYLSELWQAFSLFASDVKNEWDEFDARAGERFAWMNGERPTLDPLNPADAADEGAAASPFDAMNRATGGGMYSTLGGVNSERFNAIPEEIASDLSDNVEAGLNHLADIIGGAVDSTLEGGDSPRVGRSSGSSGSEDTTKLLERWNAFFAEKRAIFDALEEKEAENLRIMQKNANERSEILFREAEARQKATDELFAQMEANNAEEQRIEEKRLREIQEQGLEEYLHKKEQKDKLLAMAKEHAEQVASIIATSVLNTKRFEKDEDISAEAKAHREKEEVITSRYNLGTQLLNAGIASVLQGGIKLAAGNLIMGPIMIGAGTAAIAGGRALQKGNAGFTKFPTTAETKGHVGGSDTDQGKQEVNVINNFGIAQDPRYINKRVAEIVQEGQRQGFYN